ncbi:TPA: ParB/RepB/Spo0J family partition protein [Legionella pneumophila subsp. pneumophila]|nr:ParB/RepB/Spo0J family partition protein [Legionella pneumophila subsp. pneumophila]
MAKKKVFSIGNSLSDGLEQTFAAAHNYSSELRIDVIPITKIQPDPDNPRTLTVLLEDILNGLSESDPQFKKKSEDIESLRSLSNSIIDQGILNPIIVYEDNGQYKLIAGERRTLASALAKKIDIQAKIIDGKPDPFKIRLLQWIENIERSDLSLKERIDNLDKILAEFAKQNSISKEEVRITDISKILGCAKSHAINLKAVLNADEEIKQLISTDKIKSLEKAAVLCNIESVELRNQAINDLVEGGSLKHLKSLLKKDKGKLEQVNKQSKSNLINLGSTSKANVARILLQSILNNPELSNLKEQFYQVETNDDPKIISQTLKKVIKELESIYE